MTLAYVALGGALGALARYGVSGWVYDRLGEAFPWGTLVVNVLGCLALGAVVRWLQVTAVAPEIRPFLTIGLLGAFTTSARSATRPWLFFRKGSGYARACTRVGASRRVSWRWWPG